MILFVAEKPSLGRAIAEALPRPHQRGTGFITVGNGDVVSWCIGHLLEQAEPEAYDPAFKKWCHEHLPIVPRDWQLKAKKDTASQLAVLRKLLKQADGVVHAGDPDREGQLLVDEVLHFLGKDPLRAQRLLISDLNPAAVRRALGRLRPNREFAPLSSSALARSRADWLYGINLTRAYTLQGQKVNYRGVLSVGRVQTPILGLVVRRDRDIDNFVSKSFYEVWANLCTAADAGGEQFKARWVPSESCARFLDDQKRNLSRPLAENVARRITDQSARVTRVERKKKRQRAPLPHSLSSLQIDAARRYRLSAQRVLDIAQALYEKHQAITYPRSDCRHLPAEHHAQAGAVVAAVKHNAAAEFPDDAVQALDLSRRGQAWNDAKVAAHHAIIPTERRLASLSGDEAKVYALIARNYLAQFLPDHEYSTTEVDVDIQGGLFVARARENIAPGWKVLFGGDTERARQPRASAGATDAAATERLDAEQQRLPNLSKGQTLHSNAGEVLERHTTPPNRFNDATLLSALTGIASYVSDPELKKVLRETDGLGTEATRAGIIELLFRRGFLTRVSKHIEATAAGCGLIDALPESTTLPDMTARWEATMSAIARREASYESLMTPLVDEVSRLVGESTAHIPHGLAGLGTGQFSTRKFATRKSGARGRSNGTGSTKGRAKGKTTGGADRKRRSTSASRSTEGADAGNANVASSSATAATKKANPATRKRKARTKTGAEARPKPKSKPKRQPKQTPPTSK